MRCLTDCKGSYVYYTHRFISTLMKTLICTCSKCAAHPWTDSQGLIRIGKYQTRSTRNKHVQDDNKTTTEPLPVLSSVPPGPLNEESESDTSADESNNNRLPLEAFTRLSEPLTTEDELILITVDFQFWCLPSLLGFTYTAT